MPFLSPTTLAVLVYLSAVYYVWFIQRCYRGLKALPRPVDAVSSHGVSILVPARNEEENIGRTLEALVQQDHPRDRMEIIVIDDASTDDTVRIVEGFRQRDARISLLRLPGDVGPRPSRKRGRKPEALAAGIAAATFDVIVTTDADCLAPVTWVRTLTSLLRNEVVYVVGPVLEDKGSTFFTQFRALEVLGLVGITGGRIGIGSPVNGHGGNTAFFKEVYVRAGGFDFNAVKSDEENLMHEVMFHRLGSVDFAAAPEATVRTFSPPTFASYWNQRMRWGSMHGRFRNRIILVELFLLVLAMFFPLAGLLCSPWCPELLPAVMLSLTIKAVTDLAMLRLSAHRFGERFSFLVFLAGETVHGAMMLIISTVAQFFPYQWKDRKVLAVETGAEKGME